MTATGPAAGQEYVIRAAAEGDLDAIAEFEIEIAKVSFSDEAITDPALHRRRVSGSLGKPGEIMLVAVAAREPGSGRAGAGAGTPGKHWRAGPGCPPGPTR